MSWKLTLCADNTVYYLVQNDLSHFQGRILNGIQITNAVIDPLACWSISEDVTSSANVFTGYNTMFSSCEHCLPVVCPTEPVIHRVIPDPVKIFYQIKESICDIDATKRFGSGYYKTVKELGYGVSSCCDDTPLEVLWLDKQLSDLSTLVIPGYTCHRTNPSKCWMPLSGCEFLPDSFGGTSIFGTAGEDISLGMLLMLQPDGKVYANDPSDINTYQRAIGFAAMNAVTNQQVRIIISGAFTILSWNLTQGSIYFADLDGGITTSIPVTGISQQVGISTNTTTLIVEIKQPIIL